LNEISARIEKENRKNAQLEKKIQEKKDKANYFSHKGGHLRFVAKKMRAIAEEMEEEKVNVRKEDKTIRPFLIPVQEGIGGKILEIKSFSVMKNYKVIIKKADISLRKRERLLLRGPNGIGKTTLLEALVSGKSNGSTISPGVQVGYYRQDFSTLNFDETVSESLSSVKEDLMQEDIRSVAAGFFIVGDMMYTKIGNLSEGQKGLVSFCRLVLQRPGLLILDEPTNHINFRHIPVIAAALNKYEGAMVLVSHVPEFIEQIKIDEILDLGK
jgi:ATP-binding cassette subfamily F protein 3